MLLLGARLEKLRQPAVDILILHFVCRHSGETAHREKLLLRVAAGNARLYLCKETPENPPGEPTMFCALLRKHLLGGTLTNITQDTQDRAVNFVFRCTNEIGDPVQRTLRVEFFGRNGNVILLREDAIILDALRRSTLDESARPLLPGLPLPPNPPAQTMPFPTDEDTPPEHTDICAFLEAYYGAQDRAEALRRQKALLLKPVRVAKERAIRKEAARQNDLHQAENAEEYRKFGELLQAYHASSNQGNVAEHSTVCEVSDYYNANRPLRIPLDPTLSPLQNSHRYFKLYRKAKTAQTLLDAQIDAARRETAYLESVLDTLSRAETWDDLAEIRSELEETGYIKPASAKSARKKPAKPLSPLSYTTTAGLRVLVGRNNRQNDFISMKLAKKHDVWFHAHGVPGAHVLLITNGAEPSARCMEEAARLAATHAKQTDAGTTAVDYTLAGHLKKPSGAFPGKVIYHTHNTLLIT
jgi:predicted ribosome quality control (RQC) complex YloA/Tae2 family protein